MKTRTERRPEALPVRAQMKTRTEHRSEALPVRAPFPAKPLSSVSRREPRAGNYGIAARPPAGGAAGSRSIPCKAFIFGFRARTPGRELRNRRSECRLGDQPVRAPMEKYSTKVSRRPPCCTFHYYNPERNTLSCGFMDNRRRTMDKRVDKHSCPHAYPQPCREAGYPQAPQLL